MASEILFPPGPLRDHQWLSPKGICQTQTYYVSDVYVDKLLVFHFKNVLCICVCRVKISCINLKILLLIPRSEEQC